MFGFCKLSRSLFTRQGQIGAIVTQNQNVRLIMSEVDGTSSATSAAVRSEEHQQKTAGVIVIGDEILKGRVSDINTYFLCKSLYDLGIKVGKVSIIKDEIDEIASEVKFFSKSFDYVFTTGGIGPTHDDMTYAGIAKAFDDNVKLNTEMERMIREWLGNKGYSEEVMLRMGKLPSKAKLIFDSKPGRSFPVVAVENVFIFPGVPKFLRVLFNRVLPMLKAASVPFDLKEIYITHDELSVTPYLDETVKKFDKSVIFGSYPVVDNLYYSTRITMESRTNGEVSKAARYLTDLLPENSVVSYDPNPTDCAGDKVYQIAEDAGHPLQRAVRKAIQIIEEAIDRFGTDKLVICFNGGKDCTVLLHLFYAVAQRKCPGQERSLKAMNITIENPFKEMDDFISEASDRYGFSLWKYTYPIKEGLASALSDHPEIKGVLMGTRNGDPHSKNLSYFQSTDAGWPQVMRVSPLLDWSYSEIWRFLRSLSLPYCSLYNMGYTSIGNRVNTKPNPCLLVKSADGTVRYRPAYELDNGETERVGRS